MDRGGDLIPEILSIKNARNSSHKGSDGTTAGESQGLMRFFRVAKRTWGLWLFLDTRLDMNWVFADLTAFWYFAKLSLKIPRET